MKTCLAVAFVIGCPSLVSAFVRPTTPSRVPSSTTLHAKKEATFGMGCFWKPSETLLNTEGVLDTVAGYTGHPSAKRTPSYDDVCFSRQWVEGVRVYYDDDQVSYEQLLDAFFEAQEPKMGSRQYASIIFPHDNDQKQAAEEWISANEEKVRDDGVPVTFTQVESLSPFFQAEGYHQRYWQKQRPRFAACVALLAVSSGILDSIVPDAFVSTLHTAATSTVLAGCLYILLERKIDSKVVELP